MLNTFIGIAVKNIQKDVDFLEKKPTRNGVLIGFRFEGNIPEIESMKAFLVSNGHIRQEDIVGNYHMFLSKSNKERSNRDQKRLYA